MPHRFSKVAVKSLEIATNRELGAQRMLGKVRGTGLMRLGPLRLLLTQTGWLLKHKYSFLSSGGLEVHDLGTSRFRSPESVL